MLSGGTIVRHVDKDLVGRFGAADALLGQGVGALSLEGHQVTIKGHEVAGSPGHAGGHLKVSVIVNWGKGNKKIVSFDLMWAMSIFVIEI